MSKEEEDYRTEAQKAADMSGKPQKVSGGLWAMPNEKGHSGNIGWKQIRKGPHIGQWIATFPPGMTASGYLSVKYPVLHSDAQREAARERTDLLIKLRRHR